MNITNIITIVAIAVITSINLKSTLLWQARNPTSVKEGPIMYSF